MNNNKITKIANKIYNCRRKAVKCGEIDLTEFSKELTNTEKTVINTEIPENYNLINHTKSQIIFKYNKDTIIKIARFGCDDEEYDGVYTNKKEINLAIKHKQKRIFPIPLDYTDEKLWYKTRYIPYINNINITDIKKSQMLIYSTDIIEDINNLNAYKLRREHLGYDEDDNQVYIINYSHL